MHPSFVSVPLNKGGLGVTGIGIWNDGGVKAFGYGAMNIYP